MIPTTVQVWLKLLMEKRSMRLLREKTKSLSWLSTTCRTAATLLAFCRDKKRAVRKRAAAVVCDKEEVFVQRKLRRVKVVTSTDERERILKACHSEPTSGHFGLTKTYY